MCFYEPSSCFENPVIGFAFRIFLKVIAKHIILINIISSVVLNISGLFMKMVFHVFEPINLKSSFIFAKNS